MTLNNNYNMNDKRLNKEKSWKNWKKVGRQVNWFLAKIFYGPWTR